MTYWPDSKTYAGSLSQGNGSRASRSSGRNPSRLPSLARGCSWALRLLVRGEGLAAAHWSYHLDLFCIDDSVQSSPTRPGMGRLVAVGGLHVPADEVKQLERGLEELCLSSGFPGGASGEFKWSPGRELWMHSGLRGEARRRFYHSAIRLAREAGTTAIVVVEDSTRNTAIADSGNAETDVVRMFLERAHHLLGSARSDGIVIADRPSSNAEEAQFLQSCLETLRIGTEFVLPERIVLNVLTTSSHLVRLLQLADLITGCTMARVSGEAQYSPGVFEEIVPLFRQEFGRRGGCGLKLHPDLRYVNLYHWLLGDRDFVRYQAGVPLPLASRPYFQSPLAE